MWSFGAQLIGTLSSAKTLIGVYIRSSGKGQLFQSICLEITMLQDGQLTASSIQMVTTVVLFDPLAANGMLFFKGWLSLLMGIRERVAGDGKWTGIWHMVGVDGQKFSWTYDELVQTLSKMFLMNNEKGLN